MLRALNAGTEQFDVHYTMEGNISHMRKESTNCWYIIARLCLVGYETLASL